MVQPSKVAIFTNEYPPNIYGGAGVHVEYLSQALARIIPVEVRCFGTQDIDEGNLRVKGYLGWDEVKQNTDARFTGALDALSRDLLMAKDNFDADIVHAHTWYTQLAGFWAKQLWGVPLVVSIHSLEPLRPWKVEQLGNAYHLSSWMERTGIEGADAVIAVSKETRNDVLAHFNVPPERVHVIHNGIDLNEYQPTPNTDAIRRYGVDPDRPYVLFVGRITRQKGLPYFLRAAERLPAEVQVVLCAGAPDTPEIGEEMRALVDVVRGEARVPILWIPEMLSRSDIIALYTHAAVFVCPSVYEPFGIINLEAMACETPVIASAVGGIPEIVVNGETGVLVPLDADDSGNFEPRDAEAFSQALADAINELMANGDVRERMGLAARARVLDHFSWERIAAATLEFYRDLGSGR